jgi:hypothetical protein
MSVRFNQSRLLVLKRARTATLSTAQNSSGDGASDVLEPSSSLPDCPNDRSRCDFNGVEQGDSACTLVS